LKTSLLPQSIATQGLLDQEISGDGYQEQVSGSLLHVVAPLDRKLPAALQVDIFADFVCPWSYLGKRRLEAALKAVKGPTILHWHPFQLNPAMPASGMDFDQYLESKFGSRESMEPVIQQLTRLGRAEGIEFRFELMKRVPNSVNAHCLMALAEERQCNTLALAEDLYRAFFTEGRDIGQRSVLADIAAKHGIDQALLATALDNGTVRKSVFAAEAKARESGVQGVPAFLVNRRVFVVGAQTPDNLIHVFDHAMFGDDDESTRNIALH
jgi:predicted DsbA family dithiol-disulfide isomerase